MALSTAFTGNAYADSATNLSEKDDSYYEKAAHCGKRCDKPSCHSGKEKKGEKGEKGDKGSTGRRGRDGRRGSVGFPGFCSTDLQINTALKVTSTAGGVPVNGLLSFTSPIVNPENGANAPGLVLVESVPASGYFDTVLLPPDVRDSIYLVTFGASIGDESVGGQFRVLLNGIPLQYTTLSIGNISPGLFESNTVVVVNPASAFPSTLCIASLTSASIQPPGNEIFIAESFSASLNIVKLNSYE